MGFISDHVSCISLKVRWCDINIVNLHTPSEDKDDDIKVSFYKDIERIFDQLPVYYSKILLDDLMLDKRIFSSQQ